MASNLLIIDCDDDDSEEYDRTESPERLANPTQTKNVTPEIEKEVSASTQIKNVTPEIEKEVSAQTEISREEDVETAACGYLSNSLHQINISKRDARILSTPEAARSIKEALSELNMHAYVEVRGESSLSIDATNQTNAEIAADVSRSLIQEEKICLPYQGKLDRQTQIDLQSKYHVDIEVDSDFISIKGLNNVSMVKDLIENILSTKSKLQPLHSQFNEGQSASSKSELQPLHSQFDEWQSASSKSELQTLHFQFNEGQSRCYKRNPDFITKFNSVQSDFLKDRKESCSHFDIRKDNKCLVVEIGGKESHGQKYLERLKDLKRQMWDGKLNLYRISKEESDVAMMSCGIEKEQKQFINMAECQHQCGILVEKSFKKVKVPRYQSQHACESVEEEDLLGDLPPRVGGALSPETAEWDRDREIQCREIQHREHAVRVVNVDVTLYKAKCLVNFFDKESGLSTRGRIFQLFRSRGGEELNTHLRSEYKRNKPNANVTITKGYGTLNCKYVCHIALPKYGGNTSQELLQIVKDCFAQCERLDLYEIAFPALGVGRLLRYPVDEVANLLISESVSRAEHERKWKITFAIYDKENYSVFKRVADQKQGAMRREHSAPSFQGNSHMPPHPFHRRRSEPDFFSSKGECRNSPKRSADPSNMVPVIELHIFATSREEGESIRSELSGQIKEKFLHEQTIERIEELNPRNEKKVYDIGQKCDVFVSVNRGKNRIFLKGLAKNVSRAAAEMECLCTKTSQEHHTRRKENKNQHGTDAYWKHMLEEPPVPAYWKHFKDGKSFIDVIKSFIFKRTQKCYDVDPETFNAIRKLVEKTFKSELVGQGADARHLTHKKIHVKKIELIENMDVYEDYNKKRMKMLGKCIEKKESFPTKLQNIKRKPDIQNVLHKGGIFTEKVIDKRLTSDIISELNEVYLFHGTKKDFVANIVSKGMDPKHGSDGGMFGRGIYCAESSTKADQYADDKSSRGQKGKMFLMRLLLGHTYVTEQDKKYKQPPCKQCLRDNCVDASHVRFDSVVGVKQQTGGLFREFVVYDKDQCYPEYLITYTRL